MPQENKNPPSKSSKTAEILTQVRIFAGCTMDATKVKAFCFVLVYFRVFMTLWPWVSQSGIRQAFAVIGTSDFYGCCDIGGLVEAGCCVVLLTCLEFGWQGARYTLFSWETCANCATVLLSLSPRERERASERACVCLSVCLCVSTYVCSQYIYMCIHCNLVYVTSLTSGQNAHTFVGAWEILLYCLWLCLFKRFAVFYG